ncbi:hypothetical protein D3C87_299960 [compost metagenome]
MKTLKSILAFSLMAMGLLTMGCSKDSGSSNNNGYYYNNGVCYNGNQQVNYTYCQNNNVNNNYYSDGGICRDRTTGYQVNMTMCNNNNGYNNGYGQQCIGLYWWDSYQGRQQVQCNGMDCRGWTLTSVTTGQSTMCQ